jgi:hypothetical protein
MAAICLWLLVTRGLYPALGIMLVFVVMVALQRRADTTERQAPMSPAAAPPSGPSAQPDVALPLAWLEPSWEDAGARQAAEANRFDLSTRRDQLTLFLLLSPVWGPVLALVTGRLDPGAGPAITLIIIWVSQAIGGALLMMRKLPIWVRLIVLVLWLPVMALVLFFGGWIVLGLLGAKA